VPSSTTRKEDELYGLVDWHRLWSDEGGPQTDWLAEPILPTGRQAAIFSPAKVGKSLLALDVAAARATGRPVLGAGSQEPLSVLYVDHEMTEADLRERLDDMGYGPEDDLTRLHYCLHPPLTALDREDQGDELVRLVERHEARLVVIDTMARAVSGDENEADTYRHFYAHTGRQLKQLGVTLLRLDHAGKDISRGQRGSSSKDDDVDVVWKLTEADASHLILTRTRSRVPWVPPEVTLRREEEPWLRHVASLLAVPAGTYEVAGLLDELGVPVDATVRTALTTLRAGGKGRRKALVVAAQRHRQARL
jgi:hypothetical protein